MYAHNHPLEDGTLIIEIPASEVLELHGEIVSRSYPCPREDELLTILEAAHAGTLGDRYARPDTSTADRLEYLRGELRAERISYYELAELQGYGETGQIPADDLELREAAGLPEHDDDDPPLADQLGNHGIRL